MPQCRIPERSMKKLMAFSVLILFLAGCNGNRDAGVQTISESNAALLANLEIAEEKLEASKKAYLDALASLADKKEESYSAGFYDGCIILYLMMEEDEFVEVNEADLDRVNEEIKTTCIKAMSISQRFWQDLNEDGSYFGLHPTE